MGIIADRSMWRCMTWQAYRSAVKRGRLNDVAGTDTPELVVVDECHIGGNNRNDANASFTAIRASAKRVIWVSATPWDLNERVMGRREGHTAILSMPDAFKLGLLNPTDIVRIDCGLKLRAAVAQLEMKTKTPFAMLAANSLEIDSQSAVQAYDQLADQVHEMLGRQIRVTDVSTIVRHRVRLLADLYLQKHKTERAMFWLPNQAYAKECARYLAERLPQSKTAEAIIHEAARSTAEAEYALRARDSFADPNGNVRVACVVFRLREGFDSPSLRLGFDCSWSPRNLKAAVQKIGRLTRNSASKRRSQFYYAVDVKTIAGARSASMSDAYIGAVQNALDSDEDTATFTAESIIEAGAITAAMNGHENSNPRAFAATPSWRATPTKATIPLFDFDAVSGFAEISRATLDSAFLPTAKEIPEEAVREIALGVINMLERGQTLCDTNHIGHNALHRLCFKDDTSYDLGIVRRVNRVAPGLAYRWRCTLSAKVLARMAREDEIVEAIERGASRPDRSTDEWKTLTRLLTKGHRCFRADLARRMAALGKYEEKQARNERLRAETEAHIDRIIGAIEQGATPPKQGTADRRRLDGWLSPFGRKTRPDVRKRIAIAQPNLLPKGISKADREQRRLEVTSAIVAWVSNNKAIPPATSHEGKALRNWLKSKPSFLPSVIEAIHQAAHPARLKLPTVNATTSGSQLDQFQTLKSRADGHTEIETSERKTSRTIIRANVSALPPVRPALHSIVQVVG